jgi:hypothetical protein
MLSGTFKFTFRYTYNVFSLILSLMILFIYPIELEIKDTTDTMRFASYLDLHIEIDSDDRTFTTKEIITFFPL